MQSYAVPESTSLSQKVEFFISCRKLKDLDTFSKSDPVVAVYEQGLNKQWMLKGKTEMIKNNLNPDFKKGIMMDYSFEKHQNLKFEVIDDDGAGSSDMIGITETTMGTIMGSRAQTFAVDLSHQGKQGKRG